MDRIEKNEGVYYTQNVENLPIEERVFFTQGLVANKNYYRVATANEIEAWKELQHKSNEDMQL